MVKPIVKDVMFLGQKSEPATADEAGHYRLTGYLKSTQGWVCRHGGKHDWM